MTASALRLSEAYVRMSAMRRGATAERRRFRRVPITVGGRMMDQTGLEHDCRTADISPGDIRVNTAANVAVGDRIVFYLDELGRLEGHVARKIGEDEFAVILSATPHKREKLAEALTLMMSKDRLSPEIEARRLPRHGAGATATLDVEGGPVIEGEVVDFSLVGMAIRTRQPAPLIGTWVRVGGVYGRVARLIDGGFAVDFEQRALYSR